MWLRVFVYRLTYFAAKGYSKSAAGRGFRGVLSVCVEENGGRGRSVGLPEAWSRLPPFLLHFVLFQGEEARWNTLRNRVYMAMRSPVFTID